MNACALNGVRAAYLALFLGACLLNGPFALAQDRDWIEESNRHAQLLLEVLAKYAPETAASLGVEGYDENIFDLGPRFSERQQADLDAVAAKLADARESARDPRVQQDLDILVQSARDLSHTAVLNRRLMLPYFDLPQAIFSGFQDLLDERVAKSRHPAALVRLKRYAGTAPGYEPITKLAQQRFAEAAKDPTLTGPWTKEVEQHLENQPRYLKGIRELLEKSGLKGWQSDFKRLSRELDDYASWVRKEVMPRARATNRLPPEIYANNLKTFGVPVSPQELIQQAQFAYMQTRDELETVARTVARERGWPFVSYLDVLRRLKQERIPNERLLEVYRSRLSDIEEIVRRERIVTLPEREAVIRLATEAESAATPAPHVDPPRLIGNTGEPAEFVLPLSNPNASSAAEMDDFNFDAITWTLTAHEARPGHELQFAKMMEQGVSTARVVFAFNSGNVEGWALYAEAVMKKYLPPEGQLGALQMRLMRAARAFLDPMLNLGMIEPAAAKRLLMEEVGLSEPMAQQEVDRYTFRAPGQATAYFYGYAKLAALRTKVELALPEGFDEQRFHDFIVSQGLLPLDVLERAVLETFVPAQRGPAATEATH